MQDESTWVETKQHYSNKQSSCKSTCMQILLGLSCMNPVEESIFSPAFRAWMSTLADHLWAHLHYCWAVISLARFSEMTKLISPQTWGTEITLEACSYPTPWNMKSNLHTTKSRETFGQDSRKNRRCLIFCKNKVLRLPHEVRRFLSSRVVQVYWLLLLSLPH